jgi:carotenoid 1,2-hydratase
VFSPYYAAARRRGPADPLDYCAVNVALYNAAGNRWSMTERRRRSVVRTADTLSIAPSSVAWDGNSLSISIAETTVPLPRALRGEIRVFPAALADHTFALDTAGLHRWQPIAPVARVEARFDRPDLRWTGEGYIDSNDGDAPLESSFSRWEWSRAALRDGTAVLYDAARHDGEPMSLALAFARNGEVRAFTPPPVTAMPDTLWRLSRSTRTDDGTAPRIVRPLEDAPFYARTAIETRLLGEQVLAVHESLSLDRFGRRWVQALLPFRMPRAWR